MPLMDELATRPIIRHDQPHQQAGFWTPTRLAQGVAFFLCVGLAARLCRYLLRFPLWEDEAFLAYNLWNRDFLGLLQPLDYGQVAPIGYLWLQRAVVGVLGFNEWTLRLSGLATGIASLFLFWRITKLTLSERGQLFAVAVFAVSYPMLRYSAEAKQYGLDLCLALALVWCFLNARFEASRRWQMALVGIAAIGPWLSHPIVFTGGAISVVWAWDLWQASTKKGLLLWLAFNILLAGSFLGHLKLAHQALGQNDDFMQECWSHTFPPISEPLKIPGWFVSTHTGDFLAYPLGSGRGGSTLTFLGVLLGLALWFRERRALLLTLALIPLGLHFVAAALGRFPYGGHVKFSLYWAPWGTLLLGAAFAWLTERFDANRQRPVASSWVLGVLTLIAVGFLARDFYSPCKTQSDLRNRDFTRWFWFESPHDETPVCLHADLGETFNPGMTTKLNWSASYSCNLAIYSRRHRLRQPPVWEQITAERPLRVVEYRVGMLPFDEAAQKKWLDDMATRYTYLGMDQFPISRYGKSEQKLLTADHVVLYRFGPKTEVAMDVHRADAN